MSILSKYRALSLLILIFLSSFSAMAQDDSDYKEDDKRRQRLEAYRVRFLTEKLDLTPDEAAKFWPVYNEYRSKMYELQEAKRMAHPRGKGRSFEKDLEQMTDEEVQKDLEASFKNERAMLDLRESYFKKFKEVLPIRKVALLFRAEIDFHKKLFQKLKKRRAGGAEKNQNRESQEEQN